MLKRILALFVGIIISINCIACTGADKENILLNDVKSQSKVEQQEINTSIENGNKYLEEKNYDKAKKWYEKAISISKSNVDTYKKIEDKYLEKGRSDDAYRIIRLAIDNNVDVENMKKELKSIEDTFDVIVMNKVIYAGENYKLPNEVSLDVNGSKVTGKIKWNNDKIKNNSAGVFTYGGSIAQYGRKVILSLEVKDKNNNVIVENKKNDKDDKKNETNSVQSDTYVDEKSYFTGTKLCYITKFEGKEYNRVLVLKEVEFYEGEEAIKQASVDGNDALDRKLGKYYIRINDGDEEEYYVSEECPWIVSYDLIKYCNNVSLVASTFFMELVVRWHKEYIENNVKLMNGMYRDFHQKECLLRYI
ncbi:Ig-like domain-containing protein [uncultured Clostridium sp.]|uniref:tetratricopeptide repeat protein n=1 Tax=uncultured Clostridium sp. TaxID=59620 RepID=UPI0025CF2E15|nr:Ig-like domain-containing protein [uncultured Clostridium sp.]